MKKLLLSTLAGLLMTTSVSANTTAKCTFGSINRPHTTQGGWEVMSSHAVMLKNNTGEAQTYHVIYQTLLDGILIEEKKYDHIVQAGGQLNDGANLLTLKNFPTKKVYNGMCRTFISGAENNYAEGIGYIQIT